MIKFGTDGWRAVIGKDFNLANVEIVAQAISDYLLRHTTYDIRLTKVAVGYDNRRLSRESARRISQVLAANRIKVILSKQSLPTQSISYTVRRQKCAAGIMVTASHNPAQFNGIKIKGPSGAAVEKDVTDEVERLIGKQRPKKTSFFKAQRKGLIRLVNLTPDYLKFLRSYLDLQLIKKGRLKVLVDAMYGTQDSYIAKILKDTPCKVTTIHKTQDFSFGGIKPEPIQSCLRQASGLMRSRRFDVGLATDGDADRIAALDAQGRFISPQQIISLLLLHLIRYRKLKGAVVKTIAGTAAIERIAKTYRLKVYETPVGFKHIAALMQSRDILIGGEEAGGIGFKNYIPERDGILAGLLLLEMLIAENKSIAELLKDLQTEFGRHVYLRKDLKCRVSEKAKVKLRLTQMRRRSSFLGIRIKRIKDYDGLKFCLADESWILFRLSGTEPILRIYAESSSLSKTRKLITAGQKILNLK